MYSVSDETRQPIFEGVQGENEAREIQFDVTAWVEELGEGVCTATAKRPTDTTPYPVTVTRSGNVVTWKPNSTDTSIEGIGAFQLAFSINDVVAKTRIWNTKIAPSLVGAGDPPDPYDDWIQDLRDIAAETLTYSQNAANSADDAEAWAVGQRGGVDVPSTDPAYENNAKYWAEQSLANQYGAYIVKSASGEIASFSDGADDIPMKSLNVTITPKQSGSGDPSPSNVRPITGWTDADVHMVGANLWDEEWENGVIDSATGENTANSSYIRSKNYLPCSPQATYFFYCGGANYGTFNRIVYYDKAKNYLGTSVGFKLLTKNATFTTPAGAYWMRFFVQSSTYTSDISINYPSTDTAYEPYTGHTTPVPLGQTVYGGTVNPISGSGQKTQGEVDLGAINWRYDATNKLFYATLVDAVKNKNAGLHCICEIYKSVEGYGVHGINDMSQDNAVAVGSTFLDNALNLLIRNTSYTNANIFKTAMSGKKLVYELATPTALTTTPAQVATLLGTNNVWSDAGAVSVEYRADPTLAYNELANVIVSLGGNL